MTAITTIPEENILPILRQETDFAWWKCLRDNSYGTTDIFDAAQRAQDAFDRLGEAAWPWSKVGRTILLMTQLVAVQKYYPTPCPRLPLYLPLGEENPHGLPVASEAEVRALVRQKYREQEEPWTDYPLLLAKGIAVEISREVWFPNPSAGSEGGEAWDRLQPLPYAGLRFLVYVETVHEILRENGQNIPKM